MKRYACHRVYTRADHYLKQAFITLDEDGRVIHYATFIEEFQTTEWIGGVIVLSDTDATPTNDFRSWFQEHAKSNGQTIHAWHFSEFDFEKEEPTPTCIIRRLWFKTSVCGPPHK